MGEKTVNTVEKGKELELLAKKYFKYSSLWKNLVKEVYLWSEYPYKNGYGIDVGIDLVIITANDEKIGVQCKNFENKKVRLDDISTFLSLLVDKRLGFEKGIIITNTDLTEEIYKRLESYPLEIQVILKSEIESAFENIDFENPENSKLKEKVPKQLKDYQTQAINSILDGFKNKDRGKLIMPPGTGKTFTSLKLTEEIVKEKSKPISVIFFCPSISLLNQSIENWSNDSEQNFRFIPVVSDTTVGNRNTGDDENKYELIIPPTTNPGELIREIIDWIEDNNNTNLAIFSTYQSSDVIEETLKRLKEENIDFSFDLMICDEAHKTTGVDVKEKELSGFKKVHHDENIKAEKRLYMTATPKIFLIKEDHKELVENVYSMDDKEIYGETFFEYSFRKAIEEGHLSNYKVIIYEVDTKEALKKCPEVIFTTEEKKIAGELGTNLKLFGLLELIHEGVETGKEKIKLPLSKGIIFTNTIKASKYIEQKSKSIYDEYKRNIKPKNFPNIEIQHISGENKAIERKKKLDILREGTSDNIKILSNAKVLTEGIDVPSLDFIMFFSPKQSVVDIIQAIGRVLRKAEGKKGGYIIIPVALEKGSDVSSINDSDYKTIWQILSSLKSLDNTFEAKLRAVLTNKKEDDVGLKDKEYSENVKSEETQTDIIISKEIKQVVSPKLIKNFKLNEAYLETWAEKISRYTQLLRNYIENEFEKTDTNENSIKNDIDNLKEVLQMIINDKVEKDDILDMIVQHIVTSPIFDALFKHNQSENQRKDEIKEILDNITNKLDRLFESIKKDSDSLNELYEKIMEGVKGITNDERIDVLRMLYDSLFRKVFKDKSQQLGIKYTPIQLVDFMIRSTDYLLHKEFSKSLADNEVVILEPFAGTGTFLAKLVEYIGNKNEDALKSKYEKGEIWGNEILLLPYYVSKINVENAYISKTKEYKPFRNMLFVDTFSMMEKIYEGSKYQIKLFENYQELLNKQREAKVNVIISNPPWFSAVKSGNIENKRAEYPKMQKRMQDTFKKYTTATLKNSLDDSYIYAIRFAIDRIEKGVIAFVTNNGWLDSSAGEGVRTSLSKELSKIYVVDLKGNVNKSDKKEGGNVFDVKVGVCVVFMVKNENKNAEIYYYSVEDGLSKQDKLNFLANTNFEDVPFEKIEPNEKNDWLNQRGDVFYRLIPLSEPKNENKLKEKIFTYTSQGLKTNRDAWVYEFDKDRLENNVKKIITTYNYRRERIKDPTRIKWTDLLENAYKSNKPISFNSSQIRKIYYRPFYKKYVYFDKYLNERGYKLSHLFPDNEKNVVIMINYKYSIPNKYTVYVTDMLYDYCNQGEHTLGFPLYFYPEEKKLFKNNTDNYNITDWALEYFRDYYKIQDITKEDIFYYVVAFLNSDLYAKKFANELMREIPRIGLVSNYETFKRLVDIGKEIARLQTNYEELPIHSSIKVNFNTKDKENLEIYKFSKMKLDVESKRIIYNRYITIENLPDEMFELTVAGKSYAKNLVDNLQTKTDKESGITHDITGLLEEYGKDYVVNLIGRMATLSVEMKKLKDEINKIITDEEIERMVKDSERNIKTICRTKK